MIKCEEHSIAGFCTVKMIRILFVLGLLLGAFLWLRSLHRHYGRRMWGPTFIIAAVLALIILAATGRMHWVGAALAALLAGLKFLFPYLIRLGVVLLPWLGRWLPGRGPAAQTPPSDAASGEMNQEQALSVLGLEEGASREEILAAHRRLMQKIHPDRGGSEHLAGVLNRARDVLLA